MIKIFISILLLLLIPSISYSNILIIGDSLTPYIGYGIKEKYKTTIKYKVSSGLINKKFYNWKKVLLSSNIEKYDKIITVLGTNDYTSVKYTKIAKDFIKFLHNNTNAKIYWLSCPSMKSRKLDSYIRNINLQLERACKEESADFINVYNDTTWNKIDRTPDGIHFTKIGGKKVANIILQRIKD